MSTDADSPDIPEQSWTNPFPEGHPLHDLFDRRIRNQQDIVILVDDYHTRRGTGKTVASLQIAEGMDQNDGLTWENVAIQPEQLRNAYDSLPERTGLVFDEGEIGASNRDAMTLTNKALREIMSIGRIEQKYLVVNTPDIGFIDKDIRKLSDVWMTMLTKGLGLVHYLKRNPYSRGGSGKVLTENKGLIHFKDIERGTQLRDVFNQLTREKKKFIGGEEGQRFIPKSEVEDELQKTREKVRRETRNEVLTDVYHHPEHQESNDISQRTLGESVGLTQQQVGNIIRNNGG